MYQLDMDLVLSITLMLIKMVLFFAVFMGVLAYLTLLERRLLGFFQLRYGPNRVGWEGLLQPVADGVKMFLKEEMTISSANKVIFILAPIVFTAAALVPFVVIPFGDVIWPATLTIGDKVYNFTLGNANRAILADVDVGLLYFFAISSLGVYGLMMAGWASNNKYSLLGGVRASAQMISYELAAGLSLVGVLMVTGSMSLNSIVVAQGGYHWGFIPNWFCFKQPLAFVLFVIAVFAETARTPFDFTECENEIVAGYQMEYSSMKFAFFYLGEYAHMLTASAILVTVFLGGWQGPWAQHGVLMYILPIIYFCVKVFLVLTFFIWVRATYPRFRYDRLMKMGWKVLLPATLLNILITPVLMKLWGDM